MPYDATPYGSAWRPNPMSYDPLNRRGSGQQDPMSTPSQLQARQQGFEAARALFNARTRANELRESGDRTDRSAGLMAFYRAMHDTPPQSQEQLDRMRRAYGVGDTGKTVAERQAERMKATAERLRNARMLNAQAELRAAEQRKRDEQSLKNPGQGRENSKIVVQVSPGGPVRELTGADTRLDMQSQGQIGMTAQGYQNLAGLNADVAQRYGTMPAPQAPVDPYAAQRNAVINATFKEFENSGFNQQEIMRVAESRMKNIPNVAGNMQPVPRQMSPDALATRPLPQGMTQPQYVEYQQGLAEQAYPMSQTPTGDNPAAGQFGQSSGVWPGSGLPALTPQQHAYVQDKMRGYGVQAPMAEGPQVKLDSGYVRGPNITQADAQYLDSLQKRGLRNGVDWGQDYQWLRSNWKSLPDGPQREERLLSELNSIFPNPQERSHYLAMMGLQVAGGPNMNPNNVFQPGFSGQQPGGTTMPIPGYAEGINANYAIPRGPNQDRLSFLDQEIKAANGRIGENQPPQQAGQGGGDSFLPQNPMDSARVRAMNAAAGKDEVIADNYKRLGPTNPPAIEAKIDNTLAITGMNNDPAVGWTETVPQQAQRLGIYASSLSSHLNALPTPQARRDAAQRIMVSPYWQYYLRLAENGNPSWMGALGRKVGATDADYARVQTAARQIVDLVNQAANTAVPTQTAQPQR